MDVLSTSWHRPQERLELAHWRSESGMPSCTGHPPWHGRHGGHWEHLILWGKKIPNRSGVSDYDGDNDVHDSALDYHHISL